MCSYYNFQKSATVHSLYLKSLGYRLLVVDVVSNRTILSLCFKSGRFWSQFRPPSSTPPSKISSKTNGGFAGGGKFWLPILIAPQVIKFMRSRWASPFENSSNFARTLVFLAFLLFEPLFSQVFLVANSACLIDVDHTAKQNRSPLIV